MNLQDMQSISSAHQINGVNTKKEFTISSFHDVINYITDVSATLHSFLEVYPPGCQMFYQNGAAVRYLFCITINVRIYIYVFQYSKIIKINYMF